MRRFSIGLKLALLALSAAVLVLHPEMTHSASRLAPRIDVERWTVGGGLGLPCARVVPLVLSVFGYSALQFRDMPINPTKQGYLGIEVQRCANREARPEVKGEHLRLALIPVGTTRSVASVELPVFPATLYPLSSASLRFIVRDIAPGYYHVQLSGDWRIHGPDISQVVIPVLREGSSDVVLFLDHRRPALPAVHHLPPAQFRGVAVPVDWVDYVINNPPPDNSPWMVVRLLAQLPLGCPAGRVWYVKVTGTQIDVQGQGFQTGVPQLGAGSSGEVYTWDLMPLPAETVRLEGVIDLDVRLCRGSHPLLAKSTLRIGAPAPPAYQPPTSVPALPIAGAWESMPMFGIPFYQPLDIMIFHSDAPLGSAISISVGLKNNAAEPLTLTKPLVLNVRIVASEMEGFPVIWEGTLPPLQGTIGGHHKMEIKFDWDQRDASGRQVPPGTYHAGIKQPITVDFTLGGQPGHQVLHPVLPPVRGFFITH